MYGLENKFERNLIEKMAQICHEYYEPYDCMDKCDEVNKNKERKIKYQIYKELLLEMWGVKT